MPHVAVFTCDEEGLDDERVVDIEYGENESLAEDIAIAIVDSGVTFDKLDAQQKDAALVRILEEACLSPADDIRVLFR